MRKRPGGTRHAPGEWRDVGTQTRVLVEDDDAAHGWALGHALEREGYDIAVCEGPRARVRCPLLDDEPCPLAEGADVIVSTLPLARSDSQEVVHEHAARWPDTPLIISAAPADLAKHATLISGVRRIPLPLTPRAIVKEIREALAGSVSSTDA